MLSTQLGASADLPPWAIWLACALAAASFVMLLVELRRRERGSLAIAATGVLAIAALLVAVLRPARIAARESDGRRARRRPRRRVAVDGARRRRRPTSARRPRRGHRRARRRGANGAPRRPRLRRRAAHAACGERGRPRRDVARDAQRSRRRAARARGVARRAAGGRRRRQRRAPRRPARGRLGRGPPGAAATLVRVPIDAIATTRVAPADASVRRVSAAGAAVAHVPLPLRVEVGLRGGLACDELTVTARELRDDGPPAVLASGVAHVEGRQGDDRPHDHARARRRAHRRGRHRAARRRHHPRERPTPRHVQRGPRARARPPRRRPPDRTTCARSASG